MDKIYVLGDIKEWSKLSWRCGCGALNAGWLNKCGKCDNEKIKNMD